MDKAVSVTRCENYEYENVRGTLLHALEDVGGLDFVKSGMRVAVKVNLVSAHAPEAAVTPHPAVVAALCSLIGERGGRCVIGDSPGGPFNRVFLENVYRRCGMYDAAKRSGAELNMDFSTEAVAVKGETLDSFTAASWLMRCDAVVDLCKLKTHALTAYTGACKNMFGAVAGLEKTQFHYRYPTHALFGSAIVDIYEHFRPVLCVCDGIVGMEGNGPSAGTPRQLGVLLAAKNGHCLDLAAAAIIGLKSADVPTLKNAAERGLCPSRAEELELLGNGAGFSCPDYLCQPKSEVRNFPLKSKSLLKLIGLILASRPAPDKSCVGCGKCMEYCPAHAIEIKNSRAVIDRRKCINCFCCGEFCPLGAMKPKLTFIARLLGKSK